VWRAGRIETVRKAADRVLCIFPFEKAIYDDHGVDAVFVGHPKADMLPARVDVEAARRRLNLGEGRLVAILPGSRTSEVDRLGPQFAAAAATVARECEDVQFVTAVASPKLRPAIEAHVAATGVGERFTLVDGDSIDVMSAANVVMLAAGTAALESALLGKPTISAYQVSKLSATIIRLMGLRTRYYTMPNLMADELLVPEFIQENMTPKALADALLGLLNDPARCDAISSRFAKLRSELALGADERAADAVIRLAR
jgi:lipid-A-disaccharide synthase